VLRHFCNASAEQRELALVAVEQVRTFGGVLEHPANSLLWREAGLPPPESFFPDEFGGRSYEVAQGDYGHTAPKLTWLYAVRLGPCPFRSSLFARDPGGRVERMGKFQRKVTPLPFASQLVAWASTVREGASA
jgi:hypothetical protein